MVNGGIFTILKDCLDSLEKSVVSSQFRIIALVGRKELLPNYNHIELREYPKSKKRYIYRLYYEFIHFNRLSKSLKPVLWLSMHDISPRVKCDVQAVYMHNATPFYSPKWKDWKYVPKNAIWSYLYRYLYRINIHANKYLITQQNWIRDEFAKMFHFSAKKIIVARPSYVSHSEQQQNHTSMIGERTNPFTFVYPAYPRVFKNFEVICEAVNILESRGFLNYKVILTIDGTENEYSKYVVNKYKHLKSIIFTGLIPLVEMNHLYGESDCLVFPSKLETWGLPISEFMEYSKPMIVSDLPYAYETAAGAKEVAFFNPDDAFGLAERMLEIAQGERKYFSKVEEMEIKNPSTTCWEELFNFLLGAPSKSQVLG